MSANNHHALTDPSMIRSSDSLMQEEPGDQQLFISEYTYSDEDTQYDRKRSLERHSSTDVSDIPIVKIIESQAAQSENEANKPIVSYVQSFFRAPTGGSGMSWLSGSTAKKDPKRLDLENLMKITEPADVIDVLHRAVEMKNAIYTQGALDLVTHLCEQDKSKSMSVNLGTEGACSVVDHILGLNITSSPLTEAGLRAICSLITPVSPAQEAALSLTASGAGICAPSAGAGVSSNRRRFSSAGSVYQIIKAAGTHVADEIVLEWGLRALFYLSLEQGLVQRIVTCGGCDLLAQALRTHSTCDDIVVWTCRTLCNCILTLDAVNAQDRIVCQDKLAQLLVAEVLISEFSERLGVVGKLAAQWALKAVGCLARRHEGNVHTLVELGVCELLHNVQQHFSLEDEKIAESVCWVIGNVSYPSEEAQARWGACGACNVVLTTLRKHVASEETVQEALRALRNLCYDNNANLELLRGLEVAGTVMSVIRRHQESSGVVLQWLWYAVAALAEYRPLVLQLGQEDVCAAAVASLTKFFAKADLVQWTALAVANLATELKLSVDLGAAHCCEVLVEVLNEHRNDEDVVEEIFAAIGNLSANSLENRTAFHLAASEAAMLKAISKHEKNEAVVEAGLLAISRMVQAGVEVASPASEDSSQLSMNSAHAGDSLLNSEPLRTATVVGKIVRALVKADGCKILSKAMHRHATIYAIAESGSHVLSDIALYGCNDDERGYSEALVGTELPKKTKSATVETVTNRAQIGSSTKAEELILIPLGQSNAPAALTAVLQSFMNDLAVVQWTLLALDRIASCPRNIPVLHAAGLDALLVIVLQTHFLYHHSVVNMCYHLFVHFARSDESRERIGKESGGEVLLVSMAHNMSATLPAKLGSDAISALCISPEFDAIAVMATKDSLGPSYDELDVNQRTAIKAQSSETFRARSRSNSGGDDHSSNTDASVSRTFGSLFGWQGGAASTKGDKSATAAKTVSTFELMSKKGAASAISGGGILGFAHGALGVSKGMTDQEEEMHAARALAKSQKNNSSVLITNGVTTILLTILDKHKNNSEVQIAAVNAVNSLALDATHRNELNHEGIFDSLMRAYRECLRSKAPKESALDESILSLDGSEHGPEGAVETSVKTAATAAGPEASSPLAAEEEDDDDASAVARRVLLVVLNIAIGTLCMPLTEEMEGLTSNPENSFAAVNQNSLGKLAACDMAAGCLKLHSRDSLVCEAALRAIYYLSLNNESNQLHLGAAGAVQLVMAAMRTFFFKPHIVYYCCKCIAGLSHRNVINADQFDELEVADLLYKVLNMYMEQAEVVEAACHAIFALKDLNHRLGDVCKMVVVALTTHADSASVSQYACQAIASLSELQYNKDQLDRHNVCTAVTAVLQKYVASSSMLSAVFMREDTGNAAVAQWGCTAIYYLARGNESQEFQLKLVTAGACEAVTKALLKYSEYETISHACFRSLVVLLMNNAPYKTKLGALGVCSCVVESMHMFPYSAQVAKWGCRAVAVLAESHEANIARLGVAGACESIPVILQAHPGNEYVACAGCDVMSFMSETLTNGFAARFGQAGGCEAVITVLRTHAANAHVVTRASIAVASLSRVKGNATWMGPSGACDALMNVMQTHHTNVAVSKFIISAMGNLCIIDNNRERLGALGACELIVTSARMHHMDLDTAKAAALAMGKFCEHIFRVGDSEDPLAHLTGGISVVQDQHVGAFTAADHGQQAIAMVGDGTFEMLSARHHSFGTTHTGPSTPVPEATSADIERAFQSISNPTSGVRKPSPSTSSNSLLQQSLAATPSSPAANSSGSSSPTPGSSARATAVQLSAVALAHANGGRRNRGRLYDADYCAVLVSLLSCHITDADAIRIISRTISIIAFGDTCTAEREALANFGACKALAKALQFHEGNESIGRGVCWAIKALAYHHHRNREELRKYGICAPALVVLRGFRYSKNAVETVQAAAAAIANLCQDNLGNKAAMGQAGACEGLLEVMELHYRNIEVAYLCTKALFHVCDGNHENRLKISFSGAADILMNIVTRYTDEDRILDYVFSIMIGMCLGKVGQSRLGTVGASKAVVTALYRYEKSSEYLVLLCCSLIHGLAVTSAENQGKLVAAGACKAIAQMASRYVRSTTFKATNMKILANKALPKPASEPDLVDAHENAVDAGTSNSVGGVADLGPLVSKDALSDIIGEFSVLKECCKAVVFISGGSESNRQKFQATPLLDILTSVLSTAVPYTFPSASSSAGPAVVTGNISAETLKWVRNAVDVLMGKI